MSQRAVLASGLSSDDLSTPRRSGIVLIEPPQHVLYMNAEARDFLIRQSRFQENKEPLVPPEGELFTFCLDLLNMLRRYHQFKQFLLFELHRKIGPADHPILLRGLGIPKPGELSHSRLCVLINEPRTTMTWVTC